MKLFPLIVMATLAFAVLLSGCAPQKYVCPNGKLVDSPEACPKPTPAPTAPTYSEKTNMNTIPAELSQLLAKGSKISSVSYAYQERIGATQPRHKVFIKRDLVKVQFSTKTGLLYQEDVDTIVFNTATRTATGYCEQVDYCKKTGEIGPVDYDQYYVKTPLDWADKVTSAEKTGTEKLRNRDTIIIKVNEDYSYWVDSYFGVPLKVTKGADEYHLFDNIAFNSVSDIDLQFSIRT